MALAELALGNAGAADALARRAEKSAARVDLHLPTVLAAIYFWRRRHEWL